jgi:hypothetical protein
MQSALDHPARRREAVHPSTLRLWLPTAVTQQPVPVAPVEQHQVLALINIQVVMAQTEALVAITAVVVDLQPGLQQAERMQPAIAGRPHLPAVVKGVTATVFFQVMVQLAQHQVVPAVVLTEQAVVIHIQAGMARMAR